VEASEGDRMSRRSSSLRKWSAESLLLLLLVLAGELLRVPCRRSLLRLQRMEASMRN
jgi:hypothetical protein